MMAFLVHSAMFIIHQTTASLIVYPVVFREFKIVYSFFHRGRLAAPYVSEPANMLVRFTLSK